MAAAGLDDRELLEDECLQWSVDLCKENAGQKLGFAHSSWRNAFEKARGNLAEKGGAPEVLLVKKMAGNGLLHGWNTAHAANRVFPGDLITEVNGSRTIDGMAQELRTASCVLLQVTRYPDLFHIELVRRPDMSQLGFKFEKPAREHLRELRITEICDSGLLEEVNWQHIQQGLHHFVVTAGMHIVAANGVEGDAAAIVRALRGGDAERVRLRIRRAELPSIARHKLVQQVNILSALTKSNDLISH